MSRREKKKNKQKMDGILYEQDLAKFKEQLDPLCLKVKEMGADGNCFFRSIAD
jgi:hypothetical protein